nr:unnamed protein product [Callosobruchus analis]
MYNYGDPIYNHPVDTGQYYSSQYYHPGGNMYSTLPSKKPSTSPTTSLQRDP